MSRIGIKPVSVPSSVTVEKGEGEVKVAGPNGSLKVNIPDGISVEQEENQLVVRRASDNRKIKSLHGLVRNMLYNAVFGVDKQWEKVLEVVGTGYTVKQQGEDVVFKVGYSHPVVFSKVEGVSYKVQGNNKVSVIGIDKQLVGEIAHKMKTIKKPDAYKGKGVRYEGEIIRTKPGKKAKT